MNLDINLGSLQQSVVNQASLHRPKQSGLMALGLVS